MPDKLQSRKIFFWFFLREGFSIPLTRNWKKAKYLVIYEKYCLPTFHLKFNQENFYLYTCSIMQEKNYALGISLIPVIYTTNNNITAK